MSDPRNDTEDFRDEGFPSTVPALPEGARVHELGPDLALIEIPVPETRVPSTLTPAERDVALAAFQGATNQAIAQQRGVSTKTVDKQLESIYRKLGIASRVELVLALRHVPGDED